MVMSTLLTHNIKTALKELFAVFNRSVTGLGMALAFNFDTLLNRRVPLQGPGPIPWLLRARQRPMTAYCFS